MCIGDNWTAGESLDHLIQRVGEILAYQSYNTKSPLNGRAAQWVNEHRDRLPVDPEEFYLDLSAAPPSVSELAIPTCSNCSARDGVNASCKAGHRLCGDCVIRCPGCACLLCLSCGDRVCPTCPVTSAAQP